MRLTNILMKVKQPNGIELNCFASGNGHFNFLHDKNGCIIMQHPKTGYYVYAKYINEKFIPSDFIVSNETLNDMNISEVYSDIANMYKIKIVHTSKDLKVKSLNDKVFNLSKIGTTNNIVIFVRFSDDNEFSTPLSTFEGMFNNSASNNNSLLNYFKVTSYNQFNINSYFYPTTTSSNVVSYQDSNPRSYYEPYNAVTNPNGYTDENRAEREHILFKNAIEAVSSQIPPTLNVDTDNDGIVDSVTFVVEGGPSGWNGILWPHQWSLYTQTVYINGARVLPYIVALEDNMSVGAIAHEILHLIGFVDLYHYNFDGKSPVGIWDIMSDTLEQPQQTNAYTKYRYGTWIDEIPEITTNGTYTLNPLTSPTNNAYIIRSPLSDTEFFVVEYRNKNSMFDQSIPGSGLLVYRINSALDGQGNQEGPPDEVYIYRPGGTTSEEGNIREANLSLEEGRTSIGGVNNPLFFSDGTSSKIEIRNIGTAGDQISFYVDLGQSQPEADIAIDSVAHPASVNVGEDFSYRVTIRNNGPDTAENVVFTHELSSLVNYVSASIDKGSILNQGGTIIGNIGTLNSGETAVIEIVVLANEAGTISNLFTVESSTLDPNLSNNTERVTTIINENPQQQADLAISSVLQPNTVITGNNFNYEIVVTNNGSDTAENVVFTHNISPLVRYRLSTITKGTVSNNNGIITGNIGNMAPGEVVNIQINTLASQVGIVNNVFSVISSTIDPNLLNNTARANTTIISNPGNTLSTRILDKDCDLEGIEIYISNMSLQALNTNLIVYDWSRGPAKVTYSQQISNNNPIYISGYLISKVYEIVFTNVPIGLNITIVNYYEGYYRCVSFTNQNLVIK